MVAAVMESRMRRVGTVVQTFRALCGSSELAIAAAAAPPPKAVATTASFALARHNNRVAILRTFQGTKQHSGKKTRFSREVKKTPSLFQ